MFGSFHNFIFAFCFVYKMCEHIMCGASSLFTEHTSYSHLMQPFLQIIKFNYTANALFNCLNYFQGICAYLPPVNQRGMSLQLTVCTNFVAVVMCGYKFNSCDKKLTPYNRGAWAECLRQTLAVCYGYLPYQCLQRYPRSRQRTVVCDLCGVAA